MSVHRPVGDRRPALAPLGSALVLIMGMVTAGCPETEPPPPPAASATVPIPAPNLEGAERPVVEKVLRARAEVEANPASASAWGYSGVVFEAHGLYEEAAVCYRRAAELDPYDVRPTYLLALLLAAHGPATAALDSFRRAIELRPDSAVIRYYYADTLLRAGREDEARSQYEAALRSDPAFRKALLGLGELALRRGALDEARRLLERAAELEFYDREVHAKLARLYRRQGETSKAERAALLVRAYPDLAPVPDSIHAQVAREAVTSKAHTDRGLEYLRKKQYAEAEREFRLALALRPNRVSARLNLAGVLLNQGQVTDAIRLFQQTISMAPDDPEVHNNLAVALNNDGQLDAALSHLQTALRLDPKHDGAHYNQGTVLERQGRRTEAASAYRTSLEINPVNARAHQALARLLSEGGRPQEALTHWRAAVAFGRHPPDTTFRLAVTLARQGVFGEAADLLRRGLRRAPDDIPMLAALVTILATCPGAQHRHGPQAVRLAQRLIGLRGPEHVPSLILLAAAQAETGEFAAAIRTSDRSLALAQVAGQTDLAGEIRARLQLYRAGRPYHQ